MITIERRSTGLSIRRSEDMRRFRPEQLAALAVAILVVGIFAVDFRSASPAEGAAGEAKRQTLERLRPGFLVIEGDIANDMVFGRSTKEDYEKSIGRTPEIKAAWRETDRADLLWKQGKRQAAVDGWKAVVKKHPGTEAAFAAQSNIGQTAYLLGERDAALSAYRAVIDFPTPVEHDSFVLMQCSNLRHYACAELSDIYLESGDLALASKYADLALNRYRLADTCGVWLMSYRQSIQDRITAIKAALASRRPLGIDPRAK
jgi:tetratricopeptide (TPR) repeat protein